MRNILETFFRRRWAILLITVIASLVIIIGTYSRTPQYMSETRVMIPLGRELGTPAANVQAQTMLLMVNYADQLATQMEVLNNRRLIEDAVDEMPPELLTERLPGPPITEVLDGWFGSADSGRSTQDKVEAAASGFSGWLQRHGIIHPLSPRQELVLGISRRLKIERQNDSGVIHIRFTHPNPEFARTFLVEFLNAYARLRASSGTAGSDMPFYADQEAMLREELREASNRLAQFRKEWGLLDINFQREQYTTELARLDALINQTRSDQAQASAFLEMLDTENGRREPESILSSTMRDDVALTQNLRSLAALLARESRLRAEVGQEHPELRLIQNEMEVLRESIYRAAHSTLQNQAYNAKVMLEEALRQREEVQDRMAMLEAKSLEMRVLETEVEVAGDALLSYGKNRETARVSSEMDTERINTMMVIEPPTRPFSPESPKPFRDIPLGIIFSLMLGLCYAYLMEHFSDVAYTVESVGRKFPDTPLVSIPEMRKVEKGKVAVPENALAMLERKFFFKGKALSVPKSMLVVGSTRNVGATTLAGMLATHLARSFNMRVLLVDAHLPIQPTNDTDAGVTLSAWLMDRSRKPDPVQPGDVRTMPGGKGGRDVRAAMVRISAADLAGLGDFDMIIFDAPPLNADSVTYHLASLAEATLPVVRMESTRRAVMTSMQDDLTLSGASVLGVVCNRRRFYIPQWIYKRLA